ncbi:MAG: xanthine dehydrogenase family protein subunit M [Herpetosiphon sp.]
MFPSDFTYVVPTTLQEALHLLQEHPEAKLLAGGHSLVPMLKLRLSNPEMLVDICKIPELRGIHANGSLRIGSYTTYREMETSHDIHQRLPIIGECIYQIGDPAVRNRGTIGGSLAHADPAADMPAVMLALGASMKVVGLNGERTIAADDFFVDMMQSALEQGEILVDITIPQMPSGMGSAYEKFKHPASGYAVVGVAAMIHRDAAGKVTECRIGVTGAGPRAQRAHAAEQAIKSGSDVTAASAKAAEGLQFIGDMSAGEEYRANLTRVLAKRALTRAMDHAK